MLFVESPGGCHHLFDRGVRQDLLCVAADDNFACLPDRADDSVREQDWDAPGVERLIKPSLAGGESVRHEAMQEMIGFRFRFKRSDFGCSYCRHSEVIITHQHSFYEANYLED